MVNGLLFLPTYLSPDLKVAMRDLLALHFPQNEHFRIWQFVTHMFMHGNFTHILFNMFGVFMFGGLLERIWGWRRFLVFYFAAGIGAGLIFTGVNLYEFGTIHSQLVSQGVSDASIQQLLRVGVPNASIVAALPEPRIEEFFIIFNAPVVGASGAVYGVLVAFAMLFPNAKLALIFLPVPIAAKYFVPILLLLDLFSGVTGFSLFGGGIAHFAHIGGAIIGFALMMYWKKTLPPDQ